MRQLQNDPEKKRSFYQNHRSNMPPDSVFTYGLINKSRFPSFQHFTMSFISQNRFVTPA